MTDPTGTNPAGTNPTRRKPGKDAGDNPALLALGAALAQRRRDLGVLQQDLAGRAGISRSTLHTIEHGGTGVRWEKVFAVAQALGMEMAFIPHDSPAPGGGAP
ncbi:XRE family transcriptional regulator [Corynebacterium phocae]|uniref:XRE family transcriptional regulator n=1 Tax=Corynebacterium phocae TaxID=161895 RepID=A0A1L7D177_9CORY|nr:helix-turn-helix domain-containing protein [Corynebacterium phocae]APT91837.1 XRE family transcriptional regulator [Corynebacterium phocae]KAA8727447.1 helix-turn-helix domain-containing protein [Corynebacterium phocae]